MPDVAPLVGVIGRKRSGKDTLAARLVLAHGFARVAFADPLRKAALALDPIVSTTGRRLSDTLAFAVGVFPDRDPWEAAKEDPEVRRTLQNFGVGLRDTLGQDIWVDYAMSKVDRDPGPVVITDVRFPNEAAAITARGGTLVRMVRPGQTSDDQHISETALDDHPTDYVIVNDKTVADLHSAADGLVAAMITTPSMIN